MIYHEELRLAGSIDMIFENEDGSLQIYDWKRCKEIKTTDNWGKKSNHQHLKHITDTNFWHYSLQQIYKAILEKNYDSKISGLYIVCLHPNNTNYNKFEIPNLQKEVKLLFEERLEELNSIEVEEIEND